MDGGEWHVKVYYTASRASVFAAASAAFHPKRFRADVTAGKEIELPKDLALCLKVMARNITGCRYELAGGYPMSGRSLYGGIDIRF